MYEVSVVMGLFDFIPVAFFGVTAVLLMRNFYERIPKYGFAMLAGGTINVFCAGFLKALWKLLYAAGICDFQALNTLFLPTQSLGFLMTGIAMLIMIRELPRVTLTVPPVFSGTFLFLGMMVAGLACVCTCMSIAAVRMKQKKVVILFVLSFVLSMAMGYLGSMDSTLSWVNWLDEGINIASQGCLMLGTLALHRAGIGDFLRKKTA